MMSPGTSQAIVAFALAAVPGLIVLEILEYGRAPLRQRSGARAFALYLFLSFFVWIVAGLLLGASGRLADVIDAGSAQGPQIVNAYIALSWRLAAAAVGIGIAMRLSISLLTRYANRAVERKRSGMSPDLSWLGRLAAAPVSVVFAWDDLLARLRRGKVPQIVHIRFRDGNDVYGVFAGGGRADFQADGRDMVLDAELVETDGRLVQIPGSTGVFVAAEAVASVSFLDYEEPPPKPPSPRLKPGHHTI